MLEEDVSEHSVRVSPLNIIQCEFIHNDNILMLPYHSTHAGSTYVVHVLSVINTL